MSPQEQEKEQEQTKLLEVAAVVAGQRARKWGAGGDSIADDARQEAILAVWADYQRHPDRASRGRAAKAAAHAADRGIAKQREAASGTDRIHRQQRRWDEAAGLLGPGATDAEICAEANRLSDERSVDPRKQGMILRGRPLRPRSVDLPPDDDLRAQEEDMATEVAGRLSDRQDLGTLAGGQTTRARQQRVRALHIAVLAGRVVIDPQGSIRAGTQDVDRKELSRHRRTLSLLQGQAAPSSGGQPPGAKPQKRK
jgi:hypothetical protein